ncbi:unnamed protein product, partial [Sphacelaria rigidula]
IQRRCLRGARAAMRPSLGTAIALITYDGVSASSNPRVIKTETYRQQQQHAPPFLPSLRAAGNRRRLFRTTTVPAQHHRVLLLRSIKIIRGGVITPGRPAIRQKGAGAGAGTSSNGDDTEDLEALLRSVSTLDDNELSRMALQDLSSLGDFSDLGRLDFDDIFSDRGPLDNDQCDDYRQPGHIQILERNGGVERSREGAPTSGRDAELRHHQQEAEDEMGDESSEYEGDGYESSENDGSSEDEGYQNPAEEDGQGDDGSGDANGGAHDVIGRRRQEHMEMSGSGGGGRVRGGRSIMGESGAKTESFRAGDGETDGAARKIQAETETVGAGEWCTGVVLGEERRVNNRDLHGKGGAQ